MIGKALLLFTRLESELFPFVNWRAVTQFLPHAHTPQRKWVLLEEVVWIKGYWHCTKKNKERTIQYKHLIGFYQKDCQMNAMPGNLTCSSSLQFLCQKNCSFLSMLLLEQCLTAFEVGATHSGYCVSLPSL